MRMDEAGRDTVFRATVTQHPTAFIAAIMPNGLFAPLPEAFHATGLSGVEGPPSALGLAVTADHKAIIDAWHAVLADGVANVLFHPLAAPDHLVRLHMIDLTHRYGVFAGVITGLEDHIHGQALDHTPIKPRLITIRKNQTAVIVDADPAVALVLGWQAEELRGTRSLNLVHPDDHERAIASWMDLLAAPPGAARRVRLRHLHRDGTTLWFEITNHSHLTDPEQQCVVAEMLDISDEMAAQEALHASEQLLRRLTETLPLGVVQIDAERRVIYQNERAARAIRASIGDVLGGGHLDSIVPGDRTAVDSALNTVLATGVDTDLEYGYRDARHGLRRVSANLRALSTDSGEVTGAILCLADVTEDVRLREELNHRATFDALTGCRNRASILTALDDVLAAPHRGTSAIFIDLNGFKQVNDRLGHAAGDRLLAHVASRLRSAAREGDLVGRLGGDEFVVVCRDVPDAGAARDLGESFLAALSTGAVEVAGEHLPVRASIGVSWTPPDTMAADALIAHADTAMYQAKRHGTGHLTLLMAD